MLQCSKLPFLDSATNPKFLPLFLGVPSTFCVAGSMLFQQIVKGILFLTLALASFTNLPFVGTAMVVNI